MKMHEFIKAFAGVTGSYELEFRLKERVPEAPGVEREVKLKDPEVFISNNKKVYVIGEKERD